MERGIHLCVSLLVCLLVYTMMLALLIVPPQHLYNPILQPWYNSNRDTASEAVEPLMTSDLPYEPFMTSDLPYEDSPEPVPVDTNNPPLKKILFWNDVYGIKNFGFGFGREPFLRAGCRINTCFTTSDRTRFPPDQIDALIWHWRSKDKTLPKTRLPHTRYVFWLRESPAHLYGDVRPYKNLFNWTFTYRLDSDFPNPYGHVYRRRQPLPPTDRNYAEGKTKLVAWFVSNCHTVGGRELLVKQMGRWIPVDVYGPCGSLKCPRNKESQCSKMLNEEYKFYLSFENSLCKDYITEKLFRRITLDVIPVVYGLGNYSSQAPPHSYIDALSFPSVKALADYLLYLHHNDTAYNEYFRWKRYYTSSMKWVHRAQLWCQLCERLHTDNSTKTYDLYKWFVEDSHCLSRTSPQIKPFIEGRNI